MTARTTLPTRNVRSQRALRSQGWADLSRNFSPLIATVAIATCSSGRAHAAHANQRPALSAASHQCRCGLLDPPGQAKGGEQPDDLTGQVDLTPVHTVKGHRREGVVVV